MPRLIEAYMAVSGSHQPRESFLADSTRTCKREKP